MRRAAANGLLLVVLTIWTIAAGAQNVSISESNLPPDPSAMLDVQSLTKGMLIPRMSEPQRLAIANPANGLIVYQTSTTSASRKGYWYYDAAQTTWKHLGRGEYTGVIDQPITIVNTSHDPVIGPPLGTGITQLLWFLPTMSVPPSVVVIPEFTVVGTPPAMTDYCQPDVLACSPFGRMLFIKPYYPATGLSGGGILTNPPLAATLQHWNNCTSNYRYLPYDGNNYASSASPGPNHTYGEFNSLEVDACNSPDISFLMQPAQPSGTKSFSFWIDGNQDGDFTDPGELFDTRADIGLNQPYIFFTPAPLPNAQAPVTLPSAIINSGDTKMRIMVRQNGAPELNPCFPGNGITKVYDFDIKILCGDAGPAFFPNDLNWCNVSAVTTNSAEISCYDKNGTLTDMRFHYKIIEHD